MSEVVKLQPKPSYMTAMQWDGTPESIAEIASWINAYTQPDEEPWLTYEIRQGVVTRVVAHLSDPTPVYPLDFVVRGDAVGDVYVYSEDTVQSAFEEVVYPKEAENE